MLVDSSAGNLGPDNVASRLEDHVNEFGWQAILVSQAISLIGIGGTVVTSKSRLLDGSYWTEPIVEKTQDGRYAFHVE
jgi:hypothetical protein